MHCNKREFAVKTHLNKIDLQKEDKLSNILQLLQKRKINLDEFIDSTSFLINLKNSILSWTNFL